MPCPLVAPLVPCTLSAPAVPGTAIAAGGRQGGRRPGRGRAPQGGTAC